MSKLFLVVIIFLGTVTSHAILNGQKATGIEPFAKSTVAIARKYGEGIYYRNEKFSGRSGYKVFCTGTLMSDNTVVTAAHCVVKHEEPKYILFGLAAGDFDVDKTDEDDNVRRVTFAEAHADYTLSAKNDDVDRKDIAVMKFEAGNGLPDGYGVAELLPDESLLQPGVRVTVAGYGYISPTDHGDGILRYTHVPIKDVTMAQTEITISENGTGTWTVDSGGPAYLRHNGKYYYWGITSRGHVGEGIYTRYHSFRDWFDQYL